MDNRFQASTFRANIAELICPEAAKIGKISMWKVEDANLQVSLRKCIYQQYPLRATIREQFYYC